MKKAEEYAGIIMRDEREKIVSETPTVYETDKIERVYEFDDGAIVKYEWQNTPDGRTSPDGKFNHRFTLINPAGFEPARLRSGSHQTDKLPAKLES